MPHTTQRIFVTGASGYIGNALIPELVARGHSVIALMRDPTRFAFAHCCQVVVGNPLDASSYIPHAGPVDTLIHLVGTRKPAPWKHSQFQAVDWVSIQEATQAALAWQVGHFLYLSVAHPVPVMRSYQAVRRAGEDLLRAKGIRASCFRPWYVLGPGHRWPMLLAPLQALLGRWSSDQPLYQNTRLIHLSELIDAMLFALDHPPEQHAIFDIQTIQKIADAAKKSCRD